MNWWWKIYSEVFFPFISHLSSLFLWVSLNNNVKDFVLKTGLAYWWIKWFCSDEVSAIFFVFLFYTQTWTGGGKFTHKFFSIYFLFGSLFLRVLPVSRWLIARHAWFCFNNSVHKTTVCSLVAAHSTLKIALRCLQKGVNNFTWLAFIDFHNLYSLFVWSVLSTVLCSISKVFCACLSGPVHAEGMFFILKSFFLALTTD